ncbi:MAG: hypothetical protein AB8G99_17810 [Planctomycetaceae bacterium]
MTSSIAAFLCATTLLAPQSAAETNATADAVTTARAYLKQLKTGKVKQAGIDYWHADAMLSSTFGLLYLELPEAERKRAQNAFTDFLAAPFGNKRLMDLFRSINVQSATPTKINASTVSVRLELVGDGGDFRATNTLLLQKFGTKWRITDQSQGKQTPIRVALTMTYLGNKKGPADSIPVVLERVVEDVRKQMQQR